MSKTNYLQAVISDLQRTAGPYRCARIGREQMQQNRARKAELLDYLVGEREAAQTSRDRMRTGDSSRQ